MAGYDSLTKIEKAVALKMVCQNQYDENQIAYMRLTEDFSSGFALTVDSFCAGGNIKNALIKYTDINKVIAYEEEDMPDAETFNFLCYVIKINDEYKYESGDVIDKENWNEEDKLFCIGSKYYKAPAKFLNLVKQL